MIALITFDGDGGGLCAHMRHVYSDYIISKKSGIGHIVAYPGFRSLYVYGAPEPIYINSENCALIDDLPKHIFKCKEQLHAYCNERGLDYIASGSHHFSTIFLELYRPEVSDLRRDMLDFFARLPNTMSAKKYIASLNHLGRKEYIAIHVRTFSDSVGGRKMYEKARINIMYTMAMLVSGRNEEEILVFSDDPSEGERYASKMHRVTGRVSTYGTNGLLHSSLAQMKSLQLFDNSKSLIEIINRQMLAPLNEVLEYLKPSLHDMIMMSNARVLITTQSSFGMMPAVLFRWSHKCEHLVVPFYDTPRCDIVQPY